MNRVCTFLACFLTFYQASGQIDSLHALLQNITGKDRAEIFIELARSYQTSSPDSVLKYAKSAYTLANQIKDQGKLAEAHWALGVAHRLLANYDSALFLFNEALKIVPANMHELKAEINMGIGGVYFYTEKPNQALEYFLKAAERFESIQSEKKLAPAYCNIGIIMNSNGQDKKALYYFRHALELSDKYDLLSTKLPVLVNLASFYQHRGNYDSAIYFAKSCYTLSKEKSMKFGMARSLLLLSQAYADKGLYKESLQTALEGKVLFQEMGNQQSQNSMLFQEAVALKGLGKTKEALEKCLSLLEAPANSETLIEDTNLIISDCYTKLGQHSLALLYYQSFFESYKRNTMELHKEKISELEAKYDSEKKSRQIQALNDKNQFQRLAIQQRNSLLIASLAFSFVIIVLIVLFNRQKILKKRNEMLNLEQRFLRSQMNPHFIFNALGAIQRYIIKNDPIQGSSYLAKFAALMRQILEHSREDFISVAEEVKSLKNYLEIQQLRFERKKFEYTIEVADNIDCENTLIPSMFAQPFIENALEHGITSIDNVGQISLSLTKSGNHIQFVIVDNGKGMDYSASTGHRSLATRITRERIAMLKHMGRQASLSIENIKAENEISTGVKVSLQLPFK